MLVWLHFGHATVAAMLPAALYVVDLLAERVTGGRFAFASLIWGVILTGGHPETAAYAGLLAVLFTGWIAFVERPFVEALAIHSRQRRQRRRRRVAGRAVSDSVRRGR